MQNPNIKAKREPKEFTEFISLQMSLKSLCRFYRFKERENDQKPLN